MLGNEEEEIYDCHRLAEPRVQRRCCQPRIVKLLFANIGFSAVRSYFGPTDPRSVICTSKANERGAPSFWLYSSGLSSGPSDLNGARGPGLDLGRDPTPGGG